MQLFKTAAALFAIAGTTDALRLTEEPEPEQLGQSDAALMVPSEAETSTAILPDTMPWQKPGEPKNEEEDRLKAAETIDDIRKGVRALREAKVGADEEGKDLIDLFAKAKEAEDKAKKPPCKEIGVTICRPKPECPPKPAPQS